ncbi:diguanylate cyclase domain-containing protein [Arenimonas sp. MALMAid1274]|uniref:GGDEF domain-containing protein n=1 Tax=Arenimonas sp. MALMAid1274 TaxID=3411630 RepID=UPI003BA1BBFE
MPVPMFASLRQALYRTLEGELAGMPPHERREQHRRQIKLLHLPLSNLLLAVAVMQIARVAADALAHWDLPAMLAWQGFAAALLMAMATSYRHLVSLRKRLALGFVFLALLLVSLVQPGSDWREMSALSLAGFLLVPIAGLPLMVRPRVALAGLALCAAITGYLLLSLTQVSLQDKLTFGFYFVMSATAGLVLRRARANLAARMDRQVASLWQRAVSDPLTGLLNRHGWLNLAGTAMQDALDAGKQPAVLFIDVDYFKRVNDAHGHQAGDELLRELGGIIDNRIGPGQFSARLGGEEFACLLPDCSAAQAERFAERLAAEYRQRAERFGSTLSIGIATYGQGDLLNDLLARADAALYEAKHRGRDQIVVAN